MCDFDVRDNVQFTGDSAAELRAQGRCTTGIVVPDDSEGSPYVVVELDLEEDSGKGGGVVLRLAAFNWPIIGVPITLSPRGRRQRQLAWLQQKRKEMAARPVEYQNPILLRIFERQITAYSN